MASEIKAHTYWLTRIVYLRALAFIFLVAFVVAYNQNKQLIGDSGLLPLKLHMENLKKHVGNSWLTKLITAPTILWLAEPWENIDPWLDNIALAGGTLAGLVLVTGTGNVFVMVTLWILYHSLVNVGQRWYSFGWESQLLETGFIAIWAVPLFSLSYLPKQCPPPWVTIWALRWLIVRIMLGAGLIKIRGDKCWRALTCMDYHYETQPVPNPLSYYLHQAPGWIHICETMGNHIVELVIPFLTFFSRKYRNICGILQILFQILLIISGNLSFLNWLTIVPSIAFFDDKSLSPLFTEQTRERVCQLQRLEEEDSEDVKTGTTRGIVSTAFMILIGYLSIPVVINLLSSHQMMNVSFDPLRVVNTYGAFGSVTKVRHEVIFEGTDSLHPSVDANVTWLEYEFKCKPGSVSRTPCLISPYHYRLDWLMWFAAFQRYEDNPWLLHLAGKFLINDREASSLISHNPFMGKEPPKFIRAELYFYQYTTLNSPEASAGNWYKRRRVRNYIPPVNIGALNPLFRKIGWKPLKIISGENV